MNMRWMWITLAALLAVVPWARWGDAPRELQQSRRTEVFSPAREAQDEARRAALRTGFQLQALRQADRLSSAATDAWEAGEILDLGPEGRTSAHFDPDRAPLARSRAAAVLDRWGLEAPRVAIGFYLPRADLDWPERKGLARPPSNQVARVIDGRQADGRPYCIQVGRLMGRMGPDVRRRTFPQWALLDDSGTGPGAFGACWLHARYGQPGPGVAEWMRTTGFTAALASQSEAWWERDTADRLVLRVLGLRNTAWLDGRLGREPRLADHCIAGQAEACRTLFLLPTGGADQTTRNDVVPNAATIVLWTTNYLPENWLHSLEAEYGPERMAAFWTSEADVVTAFEEAFGTDVETAMMELGRERFGHAEPGPRVAGWGWMGLLAALVVGIGGAVGAVGRRSVA